MPQLAGACADAITGTFLVAVPLLLAGFLLTWLLEEVPLRTSSADGDRSGYDSSDGASRPVGAGSSAEV